MSGITNNIITNPMDKQSLQQLYDSKLFTDIKLTLKDETSSIELNLHRNILYVSGSKYFQKLLTTEFQEKDKSEITILIPNASVCRYLIESFYQKTVEDNSAEFLINMQRCRHFLLMDCSIDCLLEIEEPLTIELFDSWIDTLEMFNHKWSRHDIDIVVYKIPNEYDLNNLPDNIFLKILLYKNYLWACQRNKKNYSPDLPSKRLINEKMENFKALYPRLTLSMEDYFSISLLSWSKCHRGCLMGDFIENNNNELQSFIDLDDKEFVNEIISRWRDHRNDCLESIANFFNSEKNSPVPIRKYQYPTTNFK